MAKKARASAGDLFPVGVPGESLEARIVLDVKSQCVVPRRLPSGSPLAGTHASAFLTEVWRGSERFIPAVFTTEGEWRVTGQRAVKPEEIDFPQALMLVGPRPALSWGEVELPLAISVPELREINVPPGVTPLDTLPAICLYRLGRKSEIDPMYQVPEMFDLGRSDLRFSPHAGRIRGLLGARVSDSYFATAMRYGYDPRRFYEGGERTLLLCAYCNGPVDETTVDCPSCGLDVRKDALVEASNVQLALERRKKCRACAGPMVQTASVCPGCRTRQ